MPQSKSIPYDDLWEVCAKSQEMLTACLMRLGGRYEMAFEEFDHVVDQFGAHYELAGDKLIMYIEPRASHDTAS